MTTAAGILLTFCSGLAGMALGLGLAILWCGRAKR